MKKNIACLLVLLLCIVFAGKVQAECPKDKAVKETEVVAVEESLTEEVAPESALPESYVQKGFEPVSDAYNKMLVGYKNADLDQVLETIADTDDVVFIGSGLRNLVIGKEEIKNALQFDFETLTDIKIDVPWVTIRGDGNVAWLNAFVDVEYKLNGEDYKKNARQSLVFHKIGDEWKIVSSHLSFPAIGVPADEETVSTEEVIEDNGTDEDVEAVEETNSVE